jgi:uncharacterized protein (TIGR04255 family)
LITNQPIGAKAIDCLQQESCGTLLYRMMDTPKKPLPDYEKPPVVEVVSGIQFKPIKKLAGPYLGILWQKFKDDYPVIKEAAPLMPVIEPFGNAPEREMASFPDILGLTRTWFETKDGNGLVQIQRDRFLHNWKKEKESDKYPHYEHVIGKFRQSLEIFERFLEEANMDIVDPTQFEITYINHIFKGEGWERLDDLGSVFRDFVREKNQDRFLPAPENFNWQTSFLLPERAGRLHVSTRLGARKTDGLPAILLEITARGITSDKSRSSMWSWFDMAHEWIVYGFADLTAESIQRNLWRRKGG